jgi:hypothetical protein
METCFHWEHVSVSKHIGGENQFKIISNQQKLLSMEMERKKQEFNGK